MRRLGAAHLFAFAWDALLSMCFPACLRANLHVSERDRAHGGVPLAIRSRNQGASLSLGLHQNSTDACSYLIAKHHVFDIKCTRTWQASLEEGLLGIIQPAIRVVLRSEPLVSTCQSAPATCFGRSAPATSFSARPMGSSR